MVFSQNGILYSTITDKSSFQNVVQKSVVASIVCLVGAYISERNERPRVGNSRKGSVHLSGEGFACQR